MCSVLRMRRLCPPHHHHWRQRTLATLCPPHHHHWSWRQRTLATLGCPRPMTSVRCSTAWVRCLTWRTSENANIIISRTSEMQVHNVRSLLNVYFSLCNKIPVTSLNYSEWIACLNSPQWVTEDSIHSHAATQSCFNVQWFLSGLILEHVKCQLWSWSTQEYLLTANLYFCRTWQNWPLLPWLNIGLQTEVVLQS